MIRVVEIDIVRVVEDGLSFLEREADDGHRSRADTLTGGSRAGGRRNPFTPPAWEKFFLDTPLS